LALLYAIPGHREMSPPLTYMSAVAVDVVTSSALTSYSICLRLVWLLAKELGVFQALLAVAGVDGSSEPPIDFC
jgi:hypothetical protein